VDGFVGGGVGKSRSFVVSDAVFLFFPVLSGTRSGVLLEGDLGGVA
jgi:hypothetical protein